MAHFDIPDEKNGAWDYYQIYYPDDDDDDFFTTNINIQTWQEDQKFTWITLILILR